MQPPSPCPPEQPGTPAPRGDLEGAPPVSLESRPQLCPEADLRGEPPLDRVLRIATADTKDLPAGYRPPPSACKLADCIFDETIDGYVDLAARANISRTQLYNLMRDPSACKWIVSVGTHASEIGLGLVHARLLHLALTSRSPAAIELYLRRFDPKFQKTEADAAKGNVTNNYAFVSGMSDSELRAYLAQVRRKILGELDAEPSPKPTNEPSRPGAPRGPGHEASWDLGSSPRGL